MEPTENTNNDNSILTQILKRVKFSGSDTILAVSVVLMIVISFNLGKLSANNNSKTPITVSQQNAAKQANLLSQANKNTSAIAKDYTTTPVYASKNSKDKLYHFPWCSGASKIAEKNKLTFTNEATAKATGYSLAGNCKR
jgi:hypothetical protein